MSQATAEAVKRHYLSLPGRTEAQWQEHVLNHPGRFNRVWRHWLRLPASDDPPPEPWRSINPETGEIPHD